ncbi:MAG: mechanosensitive ion channel family protein, partial [Xanthomonadales bacterium]|nr:mechanosensitive ion channel family protein [Xanthomonadales bacterium]
EHLDGLDGVTVQVEDGVVLLDGGVDDQESRERAEALAGRVAGAVVVVNDISRDRTVRTRLQSAGRGFLAQMQDLLAAAPLLLVALAVVALAMLLARAAGRAEHLYQRLSRNWFVRDLLRQVAQLAIVLVGIIVALQLLDATALLGSVVGALGILGLAIGFATRDTVENYIASILLSLRQPFRHEDFIRIDDIEGKVLRLTPRATVLLSLEGNHVRIPNAKVFKATIINFTRNPLRRFEFSVGVDTGIDLTRPRDLAVATLEGMPGVLEAPSPICLVEALGDSSVILVVRGWMDQRENDFLKIRSEAQRLVKEAFDEAGIVMPVPIYNVNLQRVRAERPAGLQAGRDALPAAEDIGDTARDRSVENQIRAEKAATEEADLLDPGAPTE